MHLPTQFHAIFKLFLPRFVPPEPIRELRDLTRYRVTLAQECNRIANRIQKVLEDANLKLASVATDPLSASGRAMLKAIIASDSDATKLAEMARGKLRHKIPQLQLALEGKVTAHHRFLLGELMADLEFVESKMTRIEAEISRPLQSSDATVKRLCTVPGIDRVSAWGIISEIGLDMSQFPDARHLASWAGLCPGNWESARQTEERTHAKGERLVAAPPLSIGVSTKQNNYLSALFRRLAALRGVKRATIAVAHSLLVIAYEILKHGVEYHELGANYFDRLNPARLSRRLVKRLEGLGY